MFICYLCVTNTINSSIDLYKKLLPATGDSFLMTHHRDFHWNKQDLTLMQPDSWRYGSRSTNLLRSHSDIPSE